MTAPVTAGRIGEGLAWAAAGAAGVVALSQATRRTATPAIAIGQALTPVLALLAAPVALVGAARRRPSLVVAGVAAGAGLSAVVAPALYGSRAARLAARPGHQRLRIAHANLLYTNHRHAAGVAAALMATGADILALSEVTHRHERELSRAEGADLYPHRFSRPENHPHGLAFWSKMPLLGDVAVVPMVRRPGLVAHVEAAWGPVRVVLAHPDPPTKWRWLPYWDPSLRMLDQLGRSPGPPTIVVADLNAARWHPPLRRLLRDGWRDAHEQVGRGLTASWPMGGFAPPFVRLDHALVRDGLVVASVDDFVVPGSDHRGFVVSVGLSPAVATRPQT